MSNNFRWAYIGSGKICDKTAKEIVGNGHEIVSVYSRRIESAENFAKKYNASAYSSFEDAVGRDDVDGVYIGTPHTSHLEYAIKAMQLKKPVLCEKPVGVNTSEVSKLIDTARQEDVYFAEAMWTWYNPVALKVKDWVREDKIGKLVSIDASFCIPGILKPKTDRLVNPATAGGALLDLGVYPISYVYYIFGNPDKITCNGEIKDGIDIDDKIVLSYQEAECNIRTSLKLPREDMKIVGAAGSIVVPSHHMASKATLNSDGKSETFKASTTYLTEFTKVAGEIWEGKKESSYVPHQATLDVMKIMDECRKQMGHKYDFE